MDNNAQAVNRFENELIRYNKWRDELARSVHTYHDWLERSGEITVQQSVRFYDLLETLNKGRLTIAFLAEFSRGKSELINALFFSQFKERLLPSDVGRTTMCPTEVLHDPAEEPCLKLLSVETRYRDESIAQLKNMPIEWSKIRLNLNDPKKMREALLALTDTKKVYALDARMMGLIPKTESNAALNEDDIVEVPAWRYAVLNYPHPLLTNGLSILDTPGLNALGMEPELTLSTIPNAQGVLFLLGIDTGVTKSDLDMWMRYVKVTQAAKIAVLNKIDLMWDELKTEPEIKAATERMIGVTAKALSIPPERVFSLSAQKALLGRIKNDDALVKRSGIERLELFLANEIVPIKRQLIAKSVTDEIGTMMASSQSSCAQRLDANVARRAELVQLSGKSRDVTSKLWQQVTEERESYNQAVAEYKTQRAAFNIKRNALIEAFDPAKLEGLCTRSHQAINDSWTTPGLTRGMRELIRQINTQFNECSGAGEEILALMSGVYSTFHERYNFAKMSVPSLGYESARDKLRLLVYETEQFCKDPVNIVMTEKRYMVRRFWRMLIETARAIFNDARLQTEHWLLSVPLPLETSIKDHKTQLEARLESLAKVNNRGGAIGEELNKLDGERHDIEKQLEIISLLVLKMYEGTVDVVPLPALAPTPR